MVTIKPKNPNTTSTLKKTVKKSVVESKEVVAVEEVEEEKVLPETVKTKKIMDYAEGSVEGDEYLVLQGEKEAKRVSVETLLNSDGDASKIVINGVEYAADEEGKVVVPDTFATQDFVYEEIAKAQLEGEEVDLSGYAKKSELEGLASKEEVEAAIAGIEHPVYDDSELRQMIEAIEVPSVEGLASEEFVKEQIEAIEMPEPYDDTELREIIAAIEVPSVEGLASEEFVKEEVAKLVDTAPEAMDTLKELADAIVKHQDIYDAFVAQQAAALEAKADKEEVQGLHERLDAEIANLHGTVYSEVERMNYVVSEESARAKAREDEIEAKIAAIEVPSVEGFATKEELEAAIAGIEHPVYDDSELRQMIEAIEIPEVPSIEGLASEEFVREQIAGIEHPQYDDSELRGMIEAIEVPSIEGLATETFVREEIAKAQLEEGEVDLSAYATKAELEEVRAQIPSVEGLATEQFVQDAIAGIEFPEVPSVEGLATEEFVGECVDNANTILNNRIDLEVEALEEKIAGIEHPTFDDSHLATKEEIKAVKAALEEEVARAKAREDEIAAEIDDEVPYMADLAAYPTSKFLFACGHPVYAEGQEDGSVVVSYKAMGENKEIVLSPEDAAKTYIVGGYGQDNHNSKRSLPATKVVAKNAKIKGIVGGHYFEGIVGHARIEAENCQMVAVMAGGWCGANVDGRQTRLNIVHKAEVELVNCTVSSTLYGGSQGNGVVDELNMVIDGVKAGWVTVGGSNGLTNEGCLEVKGDSEITVLQTVNRGLVRHAKVVLNDGSVKQFFLGGETEDSSVNGAINEVEVHLMGGTVDKLRLGTSEGQPFASVVKGSIFRTEVKESEFDLSQLEAVKEPEVIEYALKDHKHDEYLTAHQDISHLAVKEEMEAAHAELEARLEEEIARAKAREDEIAAEIDDEEPYMADLAAYPTSKFLFGCGHPLYVEGQEDGSVVVSYKWAGEMVGITLPAEDAAKTYIVGGYGHDNHNSKRSLPMTKVVARNAKIKGIVGGHYFEGIVGHAVIDAENCDMVAVMAGGWCGANVDGRTTRLNIVHEAECKLTNCTVSSTFYGGSQGNGTVDKSHVVLDGVKAGWATVGGSNGLTNEGHLEVKGESEIDVLQTVNRGLVRKARVDIYEGQVKQLFVGGETEDSTVTGIINEVEMNLMGGVVDKLRLGTSEGQPFAGQLEGSMRQPEVKESEVDLGLFKVIEDEVLPEYALKDHTHEGMATEEFVREEIAKAQLSGGEGEVDLSAYATKEELEAAIAGIEHPEYDDTELRGMIEAIEVPSVEGLASEEFVREEIAKAQLAEGEVDLSAYATKAEVEAAIAGIEHPQYDDSELRGMIEAIEVPSVEGLASEEYVQQQIAAIEHPTVDLEPYAKKEELFSKSYNDLTDKPEIPSVEGLATEQFVQDEIAAIEVPDAYDDTELRGMINEKASKEEVEAKVDKVEGKSLIADTEIERLAEVFNANYQFKINMLPAGQEAYVNMTGQYPNIVVTFNIPMGAAVTPEEPEEPEGTPKVFYGWIPYDETGAAGFCTPEEIHEGMDAKVLQFGFDNGTLFEAEPGEIKHEVKAPDNAWICTVVPVDSGLKGYIDDGIGGLIGFAEMDTASGFACDDLIITEPINGVRYKVSGLYVVTAGAETIIYIK